MHARIFIVEDELIVAEDLRSRLKSNNFEVIGIADSGTKAIEQIKTLKPDLLLMDVRVKGELNGIETAIIIQSYFDNPIPVVFLTGFSQSHFPYLKVLNDYIYINKPYDDHSLLTAIKRALKQDQ